MLRGAWLLLASAAATSGLEFTPNCYGWPDTNRDWANSAGQQLPRLLNNKAPDFELRTLDQQSTVSLQSLLETAPVVLQFADYSCPKFQQNIAPTNALAAAYGSKVHVVYAYVTEVHPTSPDVMPYSGSVMMSPCSIPQAYNYSARLANAQLVNSKLCVATEGFSSNVTVLIDDLEPHNATGNNPVWCTYGQGPNMGFVIAQNGTVVLELEWFAGEAKPEGVSGLPQVFTALNGLLGTHECLDKCSIPANADLCSNKQCSELIKQYPCADYYAPGKQWGPASVGTSGWCDRTCGVGTCAATAAAIEERFVDH